MKDDKVTFYLGSIGTATVGVIAVAAILFIFTLPIAFAVRVVFFGG